MIELQTNARMQSLLDATPERVATNEVSRKLLELGWVIGPGGSLLLRGMWGDQNEEPQPSEMGLFEYGVNDVYLPIVQEVPVERTLIRAAHEGLIFARACFEAARGLPAAETLTGVVSVVTKHDEDFWMQGITVRFYTERGDYPDWWGDLEKFEREAIALLRDPQSRGSLSLDGTDSQFCAVLVNNAPSLEPVLADHLQDNGELLPYVFLADVARWAERSAVTDPESVDELVSLLNHGLAVGSTSVVTLICAGFVEALSRGTMLLPRLTGALRTARADAVAGGTGEPD